MRRCYGHTVGSLALAFLSISHGEIPETARL